MNRDIAIPSDGTVVTMPLGVFKYLSIRRSNLPFQISFDGTYWQTAKQNDRWDKSLQVPLPEKIFLKALNSLAANITVDYDTNPLGTQDTAQSTQTTSARGCGGSGISISVPKAKAIGGADYLYYAGNAVDLTVINTVVLLPGVVNGKKRKTIYFNNINSANDICIFDASGGLWLYMAKTTASPVFETSSDFYRGGMSGIADKFIYCETFYELSNS